MLNPYIAGAPVVEASMFFGREDVFGWIERSLEGKFVHHILVLHGQRRVGKTSVLKQIPNFLPDKYIQVFFDLQGRTGTTLDRFLWWLASEIVRTLRREHAINIPKPDPKAFEDTEYLINEFLPGLRPVLGDYVLLLTFDEFDSLDRPEIRETLASPLIAYLRRLIEVDGLNFIFSIGSSGDKLENMQASYTDFFKSALYRKISFLTSDDSHRLITKPVEGLIKYDKKAVNRISEITSGHPYFTQLMCHELFSRCQKTGARTISADDVEAVLEDVVERGTVNLKFVWDEASDLEKWILATLAQMNGGDNQKLAQALTTQRVRFSESDLNSATIHLRDKDVITSDNRFVIHLMRLWLVANRPTDRVREELVEVNPIANRYIEIGDEYRDRGQTQQAIESYQQALNANPGNLKAQTNIATVHLNRKDYYEAATAFELALKIDDEDVAAKSGYCDANLALGDAARESGENDQALALYQKILVINAAHSDARQRSAAIYREQAERQLAAGQEDEALDSFKQAIEFTPEDDSLSNRFTEILAQKKAKMVAGWLGKAEKALSRQRWDEAAEMVEEAIKVDPESEELLSKLAEVKDAPRQFKLQGYRLEAEGAIARGNWEKAIAALETAVLLAPEDKTLREQLDVVRSDQLNAQLNLHRKSAEKAMAAGDWEAAIAARQAALRLAPEDHDLKRALEETRQAQHQAQLDRFQKQIDGAIAGGNWDEAIQAAKAAIKFAPQDVTWKNKLAEVEAARHKAQLDGLRAQAEAARKAQKWDEAIVALENYRKLEPSEAEIQAEIEQLCGEKRESELKAFKDQAESAAKAERWDEAVAAWESYLALEPEDGAEIENKIQHVRKYAKIAGDYREAQEAIRKKRFGRAIELLQGIIAQEPTYKSTSRLLVDAVEANKAIPFWRMPWVLPAAGFVVLAVLGVFFGPQAWTTISKSFTNRPVAASEAPISGDATSVPEIYLIEPAGTAAITPTPTPTVDPAIQVALDTIQNEAPLYQTSFDTWDFGDPVENVKIDAGKLIVTSENQQHAGVDLYNLVSDKYAVQFDLRVLDISPEGHCIFETSNDVDSETSSWRAMSAGFFSDGHASLARYIYPDRFEDFEGAIGEYDLANSNAITLIVLGDQITAFIDGNLVYTAMDPNGSAVYAYQALSANYTAQCEYDNFKIWDLRGLDPATLTALAAIQSEEPLYQTSFDTWDLVDPQENISLESGKLTVTGGGDRSTYVSINQPDFHSDRFAAEFDLQIMKPSQDGACILNFNNNTDRTLRVNFPIDGEARIDRPPGSGTGNDLVIGSIQFDASKSNTVKIIVLNDQISAFINGQLAFTALDPDGRAVYTNVNFEADSHMTCEFDNYKFWDLSGVDFSDTLALPTAIAIPLPTATPEPVPAFSEPILAYIESQKPSFEDNFSYPNAAWGSTSNNIPISNLRSNGELTITDIRDTFPTNGLFNATDFAIQFDFDRVDADSIGIVFRSLSVADYLALKSGYTLSFSASRWMFTQNDSTTPVSGDFVTLKGGYNSILLVVKGQNVVVFLNKELLYNANNLASSKEAVENGFFAHRGAGSNAKFDNVKFWNLDGVNFEQ